MSLTTGRTVRLSALALATGTLVATAATGAGAAPAKPADNPLLSYAGNTGSQGVGLSLHLPGGSTLAGALAAAPAPISSLIGSDGSISLSLLDQNGSLQHDATGKLPDVGTSTSTFAGGSLGSLLTALSQGGLVLNQTITSTLANTQPVHSSPALGVITNQVPAQVSGLLGLQLPGLQVSSAQAPLATSGDSVLAGLDLGKIANALPAGSLAALEATLNTVVTQLQTSLSTANGALATALTAITGPLAGALAGTPLAGVGTALTADSASLQTALTQLENELPTIISNIENGSIVSLKGLTTTHSVTQTGGVQTSTVSNKLAEVGILGGLVDLEGFANTLTTQAGTASGVTKVIAQPNLAKVQLGTNNELSVVIGSISTVQGTIADIANNTLGVAVPGGLTTALTSLTGGLATLSAALNSALSAAGVKIEQDAVTKNVVSADGTSASGALSGLQIIVDPLASLPIGALPLAQKGSGLTAPQATAPAPPLLDINVGALAADSSVAAITPARTVASPAPTAPGMTQLPYTGADLPLTGAVAVTLIAGGAALVLRRRRAGSEL